MPKPSRARSEPQLSPRGLPDVRTRISTRIYGLAAAGIGLVLLGSVLLALVGDSRPDTSNEATDFSSIPAKVDFQAPALSLRDIEGQWKSLAEYEGQVVLVNLWATWCPPCQAEMPILQRFYDRHRTQGLTVVAIEDGDPPDQVSAFIRERQITFPVWLDPTYQATDHAFRAANLPTSYVIDRGGRVKLTWVGAINETNLEKYVLPLIQE
jgi:cytochrome c biogenesis protein CcmG/thiol:disulfide interchange protein DsbE